MWKSTKLGDVATFVNGYPFKPAEWKDSGLEIIRIQNLTKSSKECNYFKGEIHEKYKVKKGDILISWSATLGVYEWNGADSWLNQHIFKVVFDKEPIDKRFFIFLIEHVLDDLKNQVHGATMKHITKGNFDNTLVPIPPLSTQEAIAEKLDKADALRKKDKELLAQYDELAQAIFIDMFGDPVRNEKGWKVELGRSVLKVIGGGTFKSTDYVSDGIPLIRIGTVNKNYFDKKGLAYIPKSFKKSHSKYLMYPGDLLITLTGTVGKDDYGNVFILENDFNEYFLNQRVAKLVLQANRLHNKYFQFYLKQEEVKKKITNVSRGVRQANISNEDFYILEITIPPFQLQKQFAEKIENIEAQKAIVNQQAQQSEDLFQALLQESFNFN